MAATQNVPYERRIIRRNGEVWPRADGFYAWAQNRMDMTAAVPWFRSTQGGVYMTPVAGGTQYVLGMYVAGFAGARSYMDAEIIISSLNGDQGDTPTSGETQRRYRAMRNNVARRRLVGIIIGKGALEGDRRVGAKNPRDRGAQLLPCNNMPVITQNSWVAGFFLPTHVWPEKVVNNPGFVWMVRLEKFDLSKQSWWAHPSHGLPPRDDQRNFSYTIQQEVCDVCHGMSPRIFDDMFLCTRETCSNVWYYNGRVVAPSEPLGYTDDFLLARTTRPLTNFSYPLGHPEVIEDFNQWWNTKYLGPQMRQEPLTVANFQDRIGDLLHGFRCPTCYMLGPRVRWDRWHCRNSGCGGGGNARFYKPGHPPTISLAQITSFGSQPPNNMSNITSQTGYESCHNTGLFTAYEFNLGEDCRLAYLVPNPGTNEMQGSSDELYGKIQSLAASGEIPLERRWMDSRGGPCLTSHFAANYGKHYVYTARVPTISFDDAPRAITEACDMVNNWTAPWRTGQEEPANELYLAGYFSGQKMNYHDDGEYGLGNIITTYTLGGQGTFRVAIKPKYNQIRMGNPNSGIFYDPVIPGCVHEQQRQQLKQQAAAGQITEDQWIQQVNTLTHNMRASRRLLLTLPVFHGYVIVMYGAKTQHYLDHCAEVDTPMRFALTFRHITTDHMDEAARQRLETRLAYDIEYDPHNDPTLRQHLDSVGDNPDDPGDELPAASPRDTPALQRRRINSRGESVAVTPTSTPPAAAVAAADQDVNMTDPTPDQPSTQARARSRTPATQPSSRARAVSTRATRSTTRGSRRTKK